MKRPAFQFYPADWLRDTSLRMCSSGARGLWIDMICFMHDGDPYGHLKVNLKVILPANLARMVGATLQETEGWLAELEDAGCFSRDEEGCIYSRRMIKDEVIRNKRAAGGNLGGNPALKVGGRLTLKDNQKPTPSSSSSSSPSVKKEPQVAIPLPFDSEQFKDAWNLWLTHKKEIGQKMPPTTIKAQLGKCAKWGESKAIAAIENAIAAKWQGLFEPKPEPPAHRPIHEQFSYQKNGTSGHRPLYD